MGAPDFRGSGEARRRGPKVARLRGPMPHEPKEMQPFQGWVLVWRGTQGSSFLATLG
jgi:hypothetical protein